MIRLWDIAYDGYNGGKDDRVVDWAAEAPGEERPFNQAVSDMSVPYNGPSLMVMRFNVNTASREYRRNWPRYAFHLLFSFVFQFTDARPTTAPFNSTTGWKSIRPRWESTLNRCTP
jgi:hypothetical protein